MARGKRKRSSKKPTGPDRKSLVDKDYGRPVSRKEAVRNDRYIAELAKEQVTQFF